MNKFNSLTACLLGSFFLVGSLSAHSEIVKSAYEYDVDGTTYEGYVAYNSRLDATRGTVLIIHDWDGLTDYERLRADMLATQGYTAFAVDLYGQGQLPQSIEENRQLTSALYADREEFRRRLAGSLEQTDHIPGASEGVVTLGYCFGGAAVLEMARAGMAAQGFVSFHGGLGLPEGQDYDNVAGAVLLLHGSADPVSGMDELAALLNDLEASGVDHTAQVYGGARHSFSVYNSGDYDLSADQLSWQALQAFLERQLP